MNHRIPCDIIQDLMPMYMDGLTSQGTDREIREHLEECGPCREMYERMKKDVEGEGPKKAIDEAEIDYLKKVRKSNLRHVILAAAAVCLAGIWALAMKLFVIGSPTDAYMITYSDINGGQLNVGGVLYDSAAAYRGYRLVPGKDGTQELVIYACLPSPWNREGVFNLEMNLPPRGTQMDIKGMTVESDGTITGSRANSLYQARNPYIGDASADGKLAGLLGISKELGEFKNELWTSREPYGWTLKFERSASNSAVFEEKMKAYACVLIALTDNLGQVSWTYTVELEDGPVERQGSITAQECSEYVGAPVKSFADDPKEVQKLLDLLGIGE